MGISLTPEEQLELFGSDKLDDYLEEAEQRWGTSDAFAESRRRTATYTKGDWKQIKREADQNIAGFADALEDREPPDGETAKTLAEAHRQQISRWFYDCPYDRHVGLAELYVSDPRFAGHFDEVVPGLSRYVHDAILANASARRQHAKGGAPRGRTPRG